MAGKENVDPDLDDFKPTKRERKGPIKPSKRFKPVTNDEEVNVLTKGYTPDNTKKKNRAWSLKVFNEWRCSREGDCLADLLTSGKFDDLNYWIPKFVNEARRSDGCAYLPRIINQLLAGLQCYMLGENHLLPKFMDCHNTVFRPIHNVQTQSVRVNKCSDPWVALTIVQLYL